MTSILEMLYHERFLVELLEEKKNDRTGTVSKEEIINLKARLRQQRKEISEALNAENKFGIK